LKEEDVTGPDSVLTNLNSADGLGKASGKPFFYAYIL
jgi:hypothetical protein